MSYRSAFDPTRSALDLARENARVQREIPYSEGMAGPATSDFGGLTEPGYGSLPDGSFARVPPTPTPSPQLLRLNEALANHLGLSVGWLTSTDGVAVLAGNQPAAGVAPLAMAYAGHQFGNWVPSLGDGRAILIGEARDRDGALREIQLKGAGRTPFPAQAMAGPRWAPCSASTWSAKRCRRSESRPRGPSRCSPRATPSFGTRSNPARSSRASLRDTCGSAPSSTSTPAA